MGIGTRLLVWRGKATQTSGGLKKSDLTTNSKGKIVSKRASAAAKKKSNLRGFLLRPRGKRKRKKINYKE